MHTPTLLDQLFKHGYSQTQIAQALAEAWLDPNHPEVFYLPELTWWKRLAKWKVSLVASIVFSLTLGIGFISLFRHEFPHFTAELIFFEPLLAIILVTVAWGAFKVINKLLD
jgi:hypothetical protein